MDKDSDVLVEKLLKLTRKLACYCMRNQEKIAKNFGVSLAECRALEVFNGLHHLTAHGLAERMELGVSRITRIVDGLVKKKLAERTTDPRDRRVCLISLTSDGKKLAHNLHTHSIEQYREIISNLNPDNIQHALLIFQELLTLMGYKKTVNS